MFCNVRAFPVRQFGDDVEFLIFEEWYGYAQIERFLKNRTSGPNGCIDSTLPKVGNGYRGFSFNSESGHRVYVRAHKLAYELYVGPVEDLHVLHKCDRPACINPEHLFLGTHTENMADKAEKSRGTKCYGLLAEIQKLQAEGLTYKQIAYELNVHYNTVYRHLNLYSQE